MKIKISGPKLNGQKPLWEAGFDNDNVNNNGIVEVVEWFDGDGGHFTDHRTIRHLFLSRKEILLNGTSSSNRRKMLLPGTMIALCRIGNVRVNLGGTSFVWRQTDDKICHALLLLQAKSEDWLKGSSPNQNLIIPDCICLGGEIDLKLLQAMSGDNWKNKFPNIENAKNLKLTSDGLAFEGECFFDWNKAEKIPAAFWATPFFERKDVSGPSQDKLYLTIDRELMNAEKEKKPDWKKSLDDFARTFQNLAEMLKQKESDEPTNTYWTSLELVSRMAIPQFSWAISLTQNEMKLKFERGEWQVLISDQKPAESDVVPRGLLTVSPEIEVDDIEEKEIIVSFSHTAESDRQKTLTFEASKILADEWTEKVIISNLTTEYESLAAADILRRQYNLTAPDEDEKETEPAILWGFMPLADGWAQLPFLNLVERHYFDALPPQKEFGFR